MKFNLIGAMVMYFVTVTSIKTLLGLLNLENTEGNYNIKYVT